MPVDEMLAKEPKAIIFSGGPASVHVDGAPSIDLGVYDAGVPILGICYGAQLVARDLGGVVERTGSGEYGRTAMTLAPGVPSVLFTDLPGEQEVWMSHGDSIVAAPEGFVVTSSTAAVPVATLEIARAGDLRRPVPPRGRAHAARPGDPQGVPVRGRGCRPTWTNSSIIEQQVARDPGPGRLPSG